MIKVTDKAAAELKRRTALGEDAIGVRLSVTNTGCSGHAYKMEHAFEQKDTEDRFELGGAVLFVPKKDMMMLLGTEIDYVEDKFNSAFTYTNPNATGQCGCGESFQV
jgi:iron-sulfur cluster assembly accessory protein